MLSLRHIAVGRCYVMYLSVFPPLFLFLIVILSGTTLEGKEPLPPTNPPEEKVVADRIEVDRVRIEEQLGDLIASVEYYMDQNRIRMKDVALLLSTGGDVNPPFESEYRQIKSLFNSFLTRKLGSRPVIIPDGDILPAYDKDQQKDFMVYFTCKLETIQEEVPKTRLSSSPYTVVMGASILKKVPQENVHVILHEASRHSKPILLPRPPPPSLLEVKVGDLTRIEIADVDCASSTVENLIKEKWRHSNQVVRVYCPNREGGMIRIFIKGLPMSKADGLSVDLFDSNVPVFVVVR